MTMVWDPGDPIRGPRSNWQKVRDPSVWIYHLWGTLAIVWGNDWLEATVAEP